MELGVVCIDVKKSNIVLVRICNEVKSKTREYTCCITGGKPFTGSAQTVNLPTVNSRR